jgi:hypothetical protein
MNIERLYLFIPSAECIGNGPLDASFSPLSMLDRLEVSQVTVLVPLLNDLPVPDSRADLPDVISLGNSFTVSRRAKAHLDGLLVDPAINIATAAIYNQDQQLLVEDYWYWSGEYRFIVDRSRASFTTYPGTDIIKSISEWAVSMQHVPEWDLFMCESQDWICSESVRTAFELNGITGCNFRRIH